MRYAAWPPRHKRLRLTSTTALVVLLVAAPPGAAAAPGAHAVAALPGCAAAREAGTANRTALTRLGDAVLAPRARDGRLIGYRLTAPLVNARLALSLSAAAVMTAGERLLTYADDDGTASTIVLVDRARACERARFTTADVVRSASPHPDGRAIYYQLVSRAGRWDLGVWRVSVTGGPAQRVLPGFRGAGAPDAYGPTYSTELVWSRRGDLAVQACGAARCRTRVLEPGSGAVRLYEHPEQGRLIALTERNVLVREACHPLPCRVLQIDRRSGVAHLGRAQTSDGSLPTLSFTTVYPPDTGLRYSWRAGAKPPGWAHAAIHRGLADVEESSRARTAWFRFDEDTSDGIAYDDRSTCGPAAIGCAYRVIGDYWVIELRSHGHHFDWGVLLWCQALPEPADGCFDVENVTLHEAGHIEGLAHYEDSGASGPWADSVMHGVSRSRPRSGWNARRFGACDVATLQRRYDVPSHTTRYADCTRLATVSTISASSTSVAYRAGVTFTATLHVADRDGYARAGGNPLNGRAVFLQRRPVGGDVWTTVASMSPGPANGTYVHSLAPTQSAVYRARFPAPDDEGLMGTVSEEATVRVGECTGAGCPLDQPTTGSEW